MLKSMGVFRWLSKWCSPCGDSNRHYVQSHFSWILESMHIFRQDQGYLDCMYVCVCAHMCIRVCVCSNIWVLETPLALHPVLCSLSVLQSTVLVFVMGHPHKSYVANIPVTAANGSQMTCHHRSELSEPPGPCLWEPLPGRGWGLMWV